MGVRATLSHARRTHVARTAHARRTHGAREGFDAPPARPSARASSPARRSRRGPRERRDANDDAQSMTMTSNADAGDEAMADAPAHMRQESSSSMSGVDVEAIGRFASTQSWGKDGEEEASRSVEGEDEDEPRKLKSVLTRKPSMAAMPILQDGFASMSESEDDADDDGDDDDEGVCSLSEFAMVLNVAAWVSGLCARARASIDWDHSARDKSC